ncbi:ABC transporter permease [Ferrimonas aestuarii]|uniref:FtsX-like permease family protein n=1 Tax=Ferrimonas aestuarii TaxID=2569539 RepID=A0A4U1BJH3_9GAMM|nr:FtsX-like permease family protein [Ferrimonas aestuarii]TKB51697.1 FtsX-like permease family protein [Ferrimonas aestuarii]
MLELRPMLSAMLRNKVGPILIILQLALTLAIVANAAFIIVERLALMKLPSGVAESEVLSFTVIENDPSINIGNQRRADIESLKAIPGVISASAVNQIPLSDSGNSSSLMRSEEAHETEANVAHYWGDINQVSALGLKIIEGRDFTSDDFVDEGFPTSLIISKATADWFFPNGSAIGNTLYTSGRTLTVVGVVERLQSPWKEHRNTFMSLMLPMEMDTEKLTRFVVRAEANQREAVLAQLSEVMLKRVRNRVVNQFETFDMTRKEAYAADNGMAKVLMAIIVLLLIVTALGVVGLASYSVNQRRKQVGTRRALGATHWQILRFFLLENAMLCLGGITIGCIAALSLSRWLASHYQVTSLPLSYLVITALGLLVLGQLAVASPAIRASRISPALATRSI